MALAPHAVKARTDVLALSPCRPVTSRVQGGGSRGGAGGRGGTAGIYMSGPRERHSQPGRPARGRLSIELVQKELFWPELAILARMVRMAQIDAYSPPWSSKTAQKGCSDAKTALLGGSGHPWED